MPRSTWTFVAGLAMGALAGLGAGYFRPHPPAAPVAPRPSAGRAESSPTDRPAAVHRALVASPEALARLRRWTEGAEPGLDRAGALEILRDWAARDPQAALAFVAGARRFPNRTAALAIPLAVIGRRDMAAVIAWLQHHQVEADRGRIAETIIPLIKDDDPERALELAFSEGVPVEVSSFVSAMEVLVRRQPGQALAAFRRLSEIGQHEAAGDLATAWYRADPAAALAWYQSQSQAPFAAQIRVGLLRATLEAGNAASFSALIQKLQPSGEELAQLLMRTRNEATDLGPAIIEAMPQEARGPAIQLWAREHLEQSPEETMKLVARSVPPEAQGEVLRFGFASWLQSDRQGAVAWLAGQPSTPGVIELRKFVDEDRAESDPVPVLAQLAVEPADPSSAAATTRPLLALAGRDPVGAADWISQHANKVEPDAASQIMQNYIARDESAASQWVSTLPRGAMQDAALEAVATHWSDRGELQFATDSLNAISDPAQRMSTMFDVFSTLAQRDEATAQHWLEEQGLSDETRLTWLAIAKRRH